MRKTLLFLIAIAAGAQALSAQTYRSERVKRLWIDLQAAQHIGLNQWSAAGNANDGFPPASLTGFRAAANLYLAKPVFGIFVDMGLGVMPAPRMRTFDLARMPLPNSGTQYYVREMLSESGTQGASAHFSITAGVFGDFRAAPKLNIMPYLGVGSLSMPRRSYNMILKEDGSNNQYNTTYTWGTGSGDEYEPDSQMLGYLTGRLIFRYRLDKGANLLFGLEYSYFFDTMTFSGRFSNTFNGNVRRSFSVDGNNMNMLGLSVGVSFR